MAEILQGFRSDSDFEHARELLSGLPVFEMLGQNMANRTAENYRALRRRGITTRKTAECLIVTFCIERQLPLLYSDRDFDPFVRLLGLNPAISESIPGH